MRGIATPTTVWSSAARSSAIATPTVARTSCLLDDPWVISSPPNQVACNESKAIGYCGRKRSAIGLKIETNMLNASARLLRLLTLLETRREWRGAELAARLQISPRTVRNDVARLRELGYPVQATPGVAGGYRLAAGAALPPLLLEDDRAAAAAPAPRPSPRGRAGG